MFGNTFDGNIQVLGSFEEDRLKMTRFQSNSESEKLNRFVKTLCVEAATVAL